MRNGFVDVAVQVVHHAELDVCVGAVFSRLTFFHCYYYHHRCRRVRPAGLPEPTPADAAGDDGHTESGTTKKGTILYTSTSSAFRSTAKTLRLAAGKMAVRALSQSVAKEYGKQGIHAVHIRMDCTYESPRNEALFAQMGMAEMYKTATGANKLATVADLAETYYALHEQPPTAWSNEIDLRPYTEDWTF